MSRRDDLYRLEHMRDHAIEAIAFVAGKGLADLKADRMMQLGLARLAEIVGEAAAKVSEPEQAANPQIPWPDVIGMRHRIIHGYDRLNLEILWLTVTEDFPVLLHQLQPIIAKLSTRTDN